LASVFCLSTLFAGSLLAGCGDSGEGDSDSSNAGSPASTAGSAGKGSAHGGESSGDGGAATGTSGSKNGAGSSTGGTATNGGAAASDGGEPATAVGGADSGGPGSLGAADGITGTIDGVVHTHTFALHVPQQTETVVIGANSMMYPLYDSWGIRFMPKLGEQACTGDADVDDTFITFGSQTNFSAAGTTASGNGSCTINVTSLAPKFEGTFTATLATDHGDVTVTDGQFRVPL
jgi:hypothetical protein